MHQSWLPLLAAVGLIVVATTAAQADVIFSDDFTRVNNPIVGNGWVETETNTSDVSVRNNQLQLQTGSDPSITQFAMATSGLQNITFAYDWLGFNSEAGDTLTVFVQKDGGGFQLLATHLLSSTTSTHEDWSLGGGFLTLDIRFVIDVSVTTGLTQTEGARIDNVLVSGDRIPIPEPASLASLGSALVGLAALRRRRNLHRG